jgi:uncharacterized damage-inducible protein DinB
MGDFATAARTLLLYTLWADRQMLAAVAQVAPEDLVRNTGSSFPSLLATLAHVLGAQRVWLSRFAGMPLDRVPGIDDFPDGDLLAAAWADTAAEMEFYLAALTEDQLRADLTWSNTRGESFTKPLWQPVLHLVNHTTYHRGQAVTMLRQLGYPAPTTDLNYWLLQRG